MKQLTVDSQFCKDINETYGMEFKISFPNELSGIEEVKRYLYQAISSPDKLNLDAMVEINGRKLPYWTCSLSTLFIKLMKKKLLCFYFFLKNSLMYLVLL